MALAEPHSSSQNMAPNRRAHVTGLVLIALAAFVAGVFSMGVGGDATFRLSRPNDVWALPALIVPAAPFNMIIAAALAFLGARQFLRGGGRWSTLSLAIGLALLIAAFLVWATAGKSFSLTGMLQATMVRAVPLLLGAIAGMLCERVGVVNIAIEGMLLAGAFAGALMGSVLGGLGGLVAAIGVGALFGFILAGLVVTYRMDQIIAGVVINLFVLGLTSYVSSQVFAEYRFLNNAPVFRAYKVPVARRHSRHRANALQPEHLRLRGAGDGGSGHLLPILHTNGPAGPFSWGASTRR
jgi:ABC-type uncharacterized transport system permease subunit